MENIRESEVQAPVAAPHWRRHYIVILPFLAPGHMIPAISLAVRLASFQETTVTLASTPLNAAHLAASLPAASPVRVQTLPFHPPEHGLPNGAENLDSIPEELYTRLMGATGSLNPHLRHLLSDIQREAPTGSCLTLVADLFFCWTVQVAREAGACHAFFYSCGAFGAVAYGAAMQHVPQLQMKGTREDEEFGLPGFPERCRFRIDQMPDKIRYRDTTSQWSEFVRKYQEDLNNGRTDAHLINTVEELEVLGLSLHRAANKDIPVWPIGPLHLLPETPTSKGRQGWKKTGASTAVCTTWLDAHPQASVLYISFGSQYVINAAQMLSLATALEASGVAFLWVIRAPVEFPLEEFRDEWLPPGFEARVNATNQGLLVRSWAPQLEMLSHPSVGAFLSHCGWNSTLEALSCGIPIMGWPIAADQYFNLHLLVEELGVGVVVARGSREGIGAGKVEEMLKEVMFGEKGDEMRRKAAELAEIIKSATADEQEDDQERKPGPSVKALDDFIQFALQS